MRVWPLSVSLVGYVVEGHAADVRSAGCRERCACSAKNVMLCYVLISRQIPLVVPIAVGPSAHGSANLAGPMQLAELHRTSYLASSEHDVDKKERYKTNAPWSTLRRPPPS